MCVRVRVLVCACTCTYGEKHIRKPVFENGGHHRARQLHPLEGGGRLDGGGSILQESAVSDLLPQLLLGDGDKAQEC